MTRPPPTSPLFPNPPLSLFIPADFAGPATNYVPESLLNSPPTNATHFLLVLDPNNLITESTKANNTASLTNTDRKSTRLNSSHSQISYAVFCLKKKNKTQVF